MIYCCCRFPPQKSKPEIADDNVKIFDPIEHRHSSEPKMSVTQTEPIGPDSISNNGTPTITSQLPPPIKTKKRLPS